MARKRGGWRGPEIQGEFPTLGYLVAEWIEAMCVIPDRAVAGDPFKLSEEQLRHLVWQFRLKPTATYDPDRPAAPFVYAGTLMVRSQKWGKAPFSSARVCAQAVGPVLFGGWDANGEPVGIPWPTPHIQIAATAEDQTENIWRALKPMIELGPLADVITDTGLDRLNLAGGGIVERVSSKSTTRLGARLTYVEIDQPESMTASNRGDWLVDTLFRNVAPLGGRYALTGNAYDPTENSVEQVIVEHPLPSVWVDWPEPLPGSWGDKRHRRRILKHAYRGAPWVDIDRIEVECDRLEAKKDPGQAERFYGNRIVAGAAKAFDLELYKSIALIGERLITIEPGRLITGGFDGSLTQDATGVVITDVELGHQVPLAVWERPANLRDDEEWNVPIDELNEVVDLMFSTWDVWRFNGDPPHYRDDLNRWAGLYGAEKVVEWWTNRRKDMALAIDEWVTDMGAGKMTHGPLDDTLEKIAAHDALVRHVGNAVRWATNIKRDDGSFMWLIGKDGQKSPRKIDLAMCAILSWRARGDAIRAGALDKPDYSRAQW